MMGGIKVDEFGRAFSYCRFKEVKKDTGFLCSRTGNGWIVWFK